MLNLNEKIINKCEPIQKNDLDLINKFTLNKLKEPDVFIFSIALCTNEIDRDFESFTKPTIEKLAKMFIGKTGIFDHKPNAANQSARIFKTQVLEANELTSFGEPKVILKATAYMIKCTEFENIIKKIEAGILKEVSISCKIGQKICSICNNSSTNGCNHQPGQTYANKKCFLKLIDPLDAYEWSFVTIPAQHGAQTIKHFNFEAQNSTLLNDAEIGQQQKLKLKKQVLKLGFLCGFDEISSKNCVLNSIVEKISFNELEKLKTQLETILLEKNFQTSTYSKKLNFKTSKNKQTTTPYLI